MRCDWHFALGSFTVIVVYVLVRIPGGAPGPTCISMATSAISPPAPCGRVRVATTIARTSMHPAAPGPLAGTRTHGCLASSSLMPRAFSSAATHSRAVRRRHGLPDQGTMQGAVRHPPPARSGYARLPARAVNVLHWLPASAEASSQGGGRMLGMRRPGEGTGMRQEACLGPEGFTRRKEARGEMAAACVSSALFPSRSTETNADQRIPAAALRVYLLFARLTNTRGLQLVTLACMGMAIMFSLGGTASGTETGG